VGGKTTLSAGLTLTHLVLQQEMRLHPDVAPLVIILTDGAGNVSQSGLPAQEESYRVCEEICKLKVRTVVINMEHPAFDQGLAQKLADHGGLLSPKKLKAEALHRTVRDELDSGKVPCCRAKSLEFEDAVRFTGFYRCR
jgi:magnesium chelatase subunit D